MKVAVTCLRLLDTGAAPQSLGAQLWTSHVTFSADEISFSAGAFSP
jgi:hypothetical protein